MKTLTLKKIAILFAVCFITLSGFAQTSLHSNDVEIKLNGTSNLHDWEMTSTAKSDALFILDATGRIKSVPRLSFTLLVKNLKSGHKQMDKNTYKALNVDENPNIEFTATIVSVTP